MHVCVGNPNGKLAGNAAYAVWNDSPPDLAWDGQNIWVCTTTGNANSAVWTMQSTTNLATEVFSNGTVSTGTVTLNRSKGPVQQLTVGGNLTIALTGWLSSGYSSMMLELVNGGSATITWPAGIKWTTPGTGVTTTTFPTSAAALQTAGTDWIELFSPDGGTTVYGIIRR
jgi:hypothetical protein